MRPTLHQGGEGMPSIPANYEFVGGEPIYLSFRVAGFQAENDKVQVRYQIVGTDPDGVLLFEPVVGKVEVELHYNDKEWMPAVRETLGMPPLVGAGEYQLKIHVADEYGTSDTDAVMKLRVYGRKVEPSDKLVIRHFALFATENARDALPAPEILAGAPLIARFVLTGFKLGDKNKFDIGYGIKILRPNGSVMYQQPEAAAESDAPFYPKRWLEGGLSLTSQPGTPAGEYTLVVNATDKVGGQSAEARFAFRIGK